MTINSLLLICVYLTIYFSLGEPRWNVIFLIFFILPVIVLFSSYGIYIQNKLTSLDLGYDVQDVSTSTETVGLIDKQLAVSPTRVGRRRADSPMGWDCSGSSTVVDNSNLSSSPVFYSFASCTSNELESGQYSLQQSKSSAFRKSSDNFF